MPPINNQTNSQNNGSIKAEPLKVGIDPVFKGTTPNPNPNSSGQPTGISAFGVLNSQAYVPNQNSGPNSVTNPVTIPKTPTPEELEKKSIVRTYQSDLQSAINANHLSSINIAIAENERMHNQVIKTEEVATPESSYSASKIIIFISTILVIAGVLALVFVFILNRPKDSVVQKNNLPSLITTEYQDEINIDAVGRNKFIDTLAVKINDTPIKVNTLYAPYLTVGTSTGKKLMTTAEFIGVAGLRIPDQIKRTLLPDFMIGMFSFDRNLPFIIFKTSYFENTYAGMLDWEKDLERDLRILFRLNNNTGTGPLGELIPMTVRKFEDRVVMNRDVRLIRDEQGKTALLYSILNKDTIVITTSEDAFKEIINRLNQEKGLKR